MPGQTMDTLMPLLKEVYEKGVTNQLNNEVASWSRVKRKVKTSALHGGKYVDFPIHVRRNSGIGSRNENEALPTAGAQGYAEAHVKWRYNYAAIALTGPSIELASDDPASFADSLNEEKTRIVDDLSKERNRQYFGDGTGVRTRVTVAPAGKVIGVADLMQLDDGGVYDIVSPAGVVRGTVTIDNYDDTPAANTITIEAAAAPAGVAVGDGFVRKGSWDREIHGLASIISKTTKLYDIDPADEKLWRAHVHGSTGAPAAISEMRLSRMTDAIKKAGGKTTVMLTRPDILRAYYGLLNSQRRYVNTTTFATGHTGLTFQSPSSGEIPFLSDSDAPVGEIQFVNEDELKFYAKFEGYKFMDRTGSIWRQKVDAGGAYDTYEANLVEYSELATKRRNTHGKIVGVIGDVEQ